MAKIKNETQYRAALQRIDELLKVVNNDTPADDKNFIELDLISDWWLTMRTSIIRLSLCP